MTGSHKGMSRSYTGHVLLRDRSIGRVWLIRRGQEDLGYVILTFGYDLEFGGRQAIVTDLYVVDRYRRLGLGTQTLHFLEETCRKMAIAALELQVERKNVAALAFYRKLGFERHDRIPLSKRLKGTRVSDRPVERMIPSF
jgi:ribosomal protein S18 acetylase RimI-like enzyme